MKLVGAAAVELATVELAAVGLAAVELAAVTPYRRQSQRQKRPKLCGKSTFGSRPGRRSPSLARQAQVSRP